MPHFRAVCMHYLFIVHCLPSCRNALTRQFLFSQETRVKAETAKSLAVEYLVRNFRQLDDPFEICITTYALHVVNHRMRMEAFNRLRSIKREGKKS